MFCIKLCCRASQTFPPFPQFICLCISKLWERFQNASKELNETWAALGKLLKIFRQSDVWRYYELAQCPERKWILQLRAVWAWNGDKIGSRQCSVRVGIYESCWRDAAVWVHQECVLCKNCSHTQVSSLTIVNKLSQEHWLGFFYFYFY